MSIAEAGPRTWKKIRGEIEKLPCKTCVDHGMLGIDGWQDVTNVNQLNRPLHNPERFATYVGEVNSAAEKARLGNGMPKPASGMDTDLIILGGIALFATVMAFVAPRTPA